jgi:hypothetical protein
MRELFTFIGFFALLEAILVVGSGWLWKLGLWKLNRNIRNREEQK